MCYLQRRTYCIIKKSHAKWIHHFLRAKGNKRCHWVAVLLSAKVKWVYLNCTPFLRTQNEEDSGYRLFTMKFGNQLDILGSVEGISFQVRRYWGWKVVIVTVHNENDILRTCPLPCYISTEVFLCFTRRPSWLKWDPDYVPSIFTHKERREEADKDKLARSHRLQNRRRCYVSTTHKSSRKHK